MPYQFPYTNLHDLDLDWILNQVKDAKDKVDSFTSDENYNNIVNNAVERVENSDQYQQTMTDVVAAGTAATQAANNAAEAAGRANSAAQTAEDVSDIVAEPFVTNKDYSEGWYVTYSGGLYKFITFHSAGAWDSSQVTPVTVGNQLTAINDTSGALGADIDLSAVTWTIGSVRNDGTISTQEDSTTYASDYIPVYDRTKIKFVNVDLRGTSRSIAGYDSNRNFVDAIVTGNTSLYPNLKTTVVADIPANVAYVRVTRHNTTTAVYMQYFEIADSAFEKTDALKQSLVTVGNQLTTINDALGADIDLSAVTWTIGSVRNDGTISTQEDSTTYASDYIPVYDHTKIKFVDVDLRGTSRSIAGYDSNRNFVDAIVTGNTSLYPNLKTTVVADIPANVAYVRVTRHNTTTAVYMQYFEIADCAFGRTNALKQSLVDNRTISKFTVSAKFIPGTSTFDPAIVMPDNTWWAGPYSAVKTAFTSGSLSGFPVSLNDGDTVRIEKYELIGSNSRLYLVYTAVSLCTCAVTYSGMSHTWRSYLRTDNALVNSATVITATNKENYFTDANDAPVNQWFEIQKGAQIDNTPYGDGGTTASGVYTEGVRSFAGWLDGTLYTFKTGGGTLINQIFISSGKHASAETTPTILYYRCKYTGGLWGAWSKISDKASPTASNIAIRKKMIAPYLDDEGNPTATDTGTPNPQYMADDPLIFNDFNNAPMNSIYQIDLDCDSTVMFNNPKPGVSSILITTGFSYVNRHGQVQLCTGIKTGGAFAYLRYGYLQAPNDYRWTNWTDITVNGMENKGRLPNNSNLNSIDTDSVYFMGVNNTYSNMPDDMNTYGFITTKTAGVIIQQTIETNDSIYIRRYSGASWSAWVKK